MLWRLLVTVVLSFPIIMPTVWIPLWMAFYQPASLRMKSIMVVIRIRDCSYNTNSIYCFKANNRISMDTERPRPLSMISLKLITSKGKYQPIEMLANRVRNTETISKYRIAIQPLHQMGGRISIERNLNLILEIQITYNSSVAELDPP